MVHHAGRKQQPEERKRRGSPERHASAEKRQHYQRGCIREHCPPTRTSGSNSTNFANFTGGIRAAQGAGICCAAAFDWICREVCQGWKTRSPNPVGKVPAILACLLLNEALIGSVELSSCKQVKDRNKDSKKAALGAACAGAGFEGLSAFFVLMCHGRHPALAGCLPSGVCSSSPS